MGSPTRASVMLFVSAAAFAVVAQWLGVEPAFAGMVGYVWGGVHGISSARRAIERIAAEKGGK